ncbi:unnamed protein product [Mytilus edulis]|uniref:Uncharacterized protein n=1 Tax=Mytilus edulis TaxID=6550 RepID=A0A8S3UJU0_MYTED|nr:unnamed protein product [Mytilus edulis]
MGTFKRYKCLYNSVCVISGQVGGNGYRNKGGGSNYLCLPNDPKNGLHQSYSNDQIYGSKYELSSSMKPSGWSESMNHNEVPRVVCYQKRRYQVPKFWINTTRITYLSRITYIYIEDNMLDITEEDNIKTCYKGLNSEYNGYMMSERVNHYRRDYACVNIDAEPLDSKNASEKSALFYSIRTKCGSNMDIEALGEASEDESQKKELKLRRRGLHTNALIVLSRQNW